MNRRIVLQSMDLRKIFSVRLIALFLGLGLLIANVTSSTAQIEDSTVVSTTTAIESAIVDREAVLSSKLSTQPLISTAVDTSGYTRIVIKPEVDTAPMYKSVAYYSLLFFLLCIFIAIVGRVLQVYELSREMQGKKGPINWRSLQGVFFVFALIIGLYGVYWSYTVHGPMSMLEAGSVHGERIDFMFKITLTITSIVFILTHIVLFMFAYKYRGSEERKAHFYPHNNALERIWTIVPAMVLTVLVIYGFFTWRSITNVSEENQQKALKIEVVGEQFKWNVRYAGNDNELGKRNYRLITPTNGLGIDFKDQKNWDDKLAGEIVLPVNRAVRVTVGSKDVLHSFYVPTLRVQINAVPGMPTYFQFTPKYTTAEMREKSGDSKFDYILLCAKICGSGHYNMQTKIRVVSENEYQEWLAKQVLYYNDDVKKEMQQTTSDVQEADENNKMAINTEVDK